jgi:hypothetical protein
VIQNCLYQHWLRGLRDRLGSQSAGRRPYPGRYRQLCLFL